MSSATSKRTLRYTACGGGSGQLRFQKTKTAERLVFASIIDGKPSWCSVTSRRIPISPRTGCCTFGLVRSVTDVIPNHRCLMNDDTIEKRRNSFRDRLSQVKPSYSLGNRFTRKDGLVRRLLSDDRKSCRTYRFNVIRLYYYSSFILKLSL